MLSAGHDAGFAPFRLIKKYCFSHHGCEMRCDRDDEITITDGRSGFARVRYRREDGVWAILLIFDVTITQVRELVIAITSRDWNIRTETDSQNTRGIRRATFRSSRRLSLCRSRNNSLQPKR